jgi:hypothetical protein
MKTIFDPSSVKPILAMHEKSCVSAWIFYLEFLKNILGLPRPTANKEYPVIFYIRYSVFRYSSIPVQFIQVSVFR